MTAQQLRADFNDQLQLRAQLETAIRDRLTWRGIAVERERGLAAAYDRIAVLERHVFEMRCERDRYARSLFQDAAPKEQA
jgi:hypothetical protein